MTALSIVKQVIENGPQNYAAVYNFEGDGSSTISGYLAADPTINGDMGFAFAGNTLYPGTHIKIVGLEYNLTPGFGLRLLWDASSAQDAWTLYGFGKQDFRRTGSIFVPQLAGVPIAGATGRILFTSLPAAVPNNATNSVKLWLRKDIAR